MNSFREMALIYQAENRKYSWEFEKQVTQFGDSLGLWNKDSKILVALSGGEDSVALLYLFLRLKEEGKIKNVRALHIHHGTRVEQDQEEKIVRLFCESLRIKLQVFYLHDLKKIKNFEEEARKRRYDIFKKARMQGEIVALGHHLDDSFEWSLMQSFKSSELISGLGIPVKRDFYIRPFLSVSKKQVSFYRKTLALPYVKDPTNDFIQYERNNLRLNIIPLIAKKYPKYLKHYARRQNELAKKLKVHLLRKSSPIKKKLNLSDRFCFVLEEHPSSIIVSLKKELKKISQLRWRGGEQEKQISQMLKSHKFGPMHLPGKLSFYAHANFVAVLPQEAVFVPKEEVTLEKSDLTSFKEALSQSFKTQKALTSYPLFIGGKKFEKGIRNYKTHSLWPTLDSWSRQHQLVVTDAFSLLEWWSRPNNRKKVLNLSYLW